MKRILGILMIGILIIVSLAGCGNSSKTPVVTDVTKIEDEVNEIAKEAGADIKVNLGQMGNNLKLPDTFPKDVAPVIDGANIVNIIDNKDNNSMGIIFTTDKKYEEVSSFYQDVLKGSDDFNQFEQDGSIILSGKKEGYRISITAVKDTSNNNISVMLDVNYSEMAEKEAKKNLFASTTEVALPDGYPSDILPVLSGDKLLEGRFSESDGSINYYLTVLSDKPMKEIVAGYEAAWKDIKNPSKDMSASSYSFQGEANGYTFYMSGDYDEESKTVEYSLEINK